MSHILSAFVAALFVVGCSRSVPTSLPGAEPGGDIPPPRLVPVRSLDESLAAGVSYLLKQQSEDGAWRSDIYATFKDGTALTPLAVVALQDALDAGVENPNISAAIRKGCNFLMKFVKAGPVIDVGPDGFEYPVYTAALTIKAFSHPSAKEFVKHRDGWIQYLKERQLTEQLGWKPNEKQYGGWGYCRVIPKKPEPNAFAPNLIESNLSATVFALEALRAADEADTAPYHRAETFLHHCQNEDGGFHFIYDDPVRNKAGVSSTQPPEFHSYGSATADGLRGLSITEPIRHRMEDEFAKPGKVVRGNATPRRKSFQWFEKNFRADTHPGKYVKAHEPNREAVYYYYVASVAKAFREHKWKLPDGRDWAAELSTELTKRQYKDGSWANPIELVRENDPIVATSNAVSALAKCKP